MNSLQEVITYYRSQIEKRQKELSAEKNKIYQIGTIRLILFIACIAGIIIFYHSNWWTLAGIVCITMIPFFLLIKVHNKMFKRKDYLEQALKINQQELKAIDYDPSEFDDGSDHISPTHPFTYDIDIFGKKSLFQYTNRTTTTFGRSCLTTLFTDPFDQEEEIRDRQQTIAELAEDVQFRQRFRTFGLLYDGKPTDEEELVRWSMNENFFSKKKWYHFIKWAIPFTNAIAITLAALNIISYTIPTFLFIVFVICSVYLTQKISKIQLSFEKELHILSTYANLLSLIEEKEFKSKELVDIQKWIKGKPVSASAAIKQLTRRMNALDQRNNILITALLNGLFFWELHQIIKVETWKDEYGSSMEQWTECIGLMDALCSLGTFAYNNPSFTYPIISPTAMYKAKGLKHPLMNREKCVPNDINMAGAPDFEIITGANMAGKSTYLRTVGINHLLGCMGMPVDAESMTFYPAHLVTSLRTNDSLNDNESYFFAELKRLKMIIDKLHSGEKLFIILDEILRGTNSADKQKGSYSFIKQLTLLGATGLIATHDLQLAHLKELFPEQINTQCFEADITNNELTFSYKLREGVAQNMNACFLMKKMGIKIEENEIKA